MSQMSYETYFKQIPPGTPVGLRSTYPESQILDMLPFIPSTSPLWIECTMPKTTLLTIAEYYRKTSNPYLAINLDPNSTPVQAENLFQAFKSLPFVLYRVQKTSIVIRQIAASGLGLGHGLMMEPNLSDEVINEVIPHLASHALFYIADNQSESSAIAIAKSLPETSRIAFFGTHFPEVILTNIASNLKPKAIVVIRQDMNALITAQKLAAHLNDAVRMYCAHSDDVYIRAIANSLKPGAVLALHPSTPFSGLLTAIRFLRPGTILSLETDLDDELIDSFCDNFNKHLGLIFNEDRCDKEMVSKLINKLSDKTIPVAATAKNKIRASFSLFVNKEDRLNANEVEQIKARFSRQFNLQGEFMEALPSMLQLTTLNKFEILQYFIDKFSSTVFTINHDLETILTAQFPLLTDFQAELHKVTGKPHIAEMDIDRMRAILLSYLTHLEFEMIESETNHLHWNLM